VIIEGVTAYILALTRSPNTAGVLIQR